MTCALVSFSSFADEVAKLGEVNDMRLNPKPHVKQVNPQPPVDKFRVKTGFAVSQYSGDLGPGGGPKYHSMLPPFQTPQLKTAGPPPQGDSREKMIEKYKEMSRGIGKPGVFVDYVKDRKKTSAVATTPAGRLSQAQKVGAPKSSAPPGPSIAQISKPIGFGRPHPAAVKTGAVKTALLERVVRLAATDIPKTPRLLMKHRSRAELKALQDAVAKGWERKVTNPIMGVAEKAISKAPSKVQGVARKGARVIAEDPIGGVASNLTPVPGAFPAYIAGKKGVERLIDKLAPV